MQVFLEMTGASAACNLPVMTIGNRIEKLLLVKNGGNMSELSRFCGVTPQAVQQWISGGVTPRGKRLQKIAEFFGISEAELAYGDIDLIIAHMELPELRKLGAHAEKPIERIEAESTAVVDRRSQLPGRRKADSHEGEIEIPQYKELGGSMGTGLLLRDQPGEIQGWRVTPDWLRHNVKNYTSAANLRIVTGFGDSMRPLYNPGDPLLVDAGVKTVEFDSIYFFRIGDEGFIKRLQRVPGQGLLAISENKSYRDWVITPDMDFEVFARVIKIWCGSDF